ncbi:acyl transferase/acyl hydrolase/lysophospholipase [Flagelloscypha sp. PMI_526]|nr:acyl transferase/acyl hydrolase/lysophospholipase [Flagelloscypha sp. PMI_526]
MSDSLSRTKGLRLLCFDGGGLCCLSQALIVKEMLDRLQYDSNSSRSLKVVDYFDMIGGSGFGGLLAIMAGVLEMTVEELVSEFLSLCEFIFSGTFAIGGRTERLKASVKRIIRQYSRDRGGEERTMLSGNDACKVFVCASSSSNMAFPRIYRNYIVRENQSLDCAVWQAACATMAMPGLFEPVEINIGAIRDSVFGGETRWNNPVRWLAEEAANVFSGHHVACIVSIGSGHPHILSISSDLTSLFKSIATDCQLQANEMDIRFSEAPELYWRLEVEQGLQDLASIEDVAAFSRILSSTVSHLQRCATIQNINALLEVLHSRPECVSTRAITGRVLATARTVRLKQCPNPTLYFTGKETELKQMTEYFNSNRDGCRVCVLYGLGGAGKTQMGLKFVLLNQNSKRQVASRVTIFDAQIYTSGLPMYSSLTPQTSIPFALISRPLQGPTRQGLRSRMLNTI